MSQKSRERFEKRPSPVSTIEVGGKRIKLYPPRPYQHHIAQRQLAGQGAGDTTPATKGASGSSFFNRLGRMFKREQEAQREAAKVNEQILQA